MYEWSKLLFIEALTPLHIGLGRAPGVVDLPIMRDNFGIPIIPGSSLKGALKTLCMYWTGEISNDETSGEVRVCEELFGPEPDRVANNPYVSLINILDAELLLYPARIMTNNNGTVYGYITSRYQLLRLIDIVDSINKAIHFQRSDIINEIIGLGSDLKKCTSSNENISINGIMINNVITEHNIPGRLKGVLENIFGNERFITKLLSNLYILDNHEDFRQIVERGIIRQTRIRLDRKTKTVSGTSLWTEEYLSHASIFYTLAIIRDPTIMSKTIDPAAKFAELLNDNPVVFIGGKETVGKGLVKIIWI